MKGMQTLASNAIVQAVAKAIREGELGSTCTLYVNAGTAGTPDGAEDPTVP